MSGHGRVTGREDRSYSLDGLRGVASLVVVLHHSLLVLPQFANAHFGGVVPASLGWFVYSPIHAVWAGSEAVYVFFILSGLVLALPVIRGSGFEWRAYYPSRLLRLYLPVYAALGLAVLAAVLLPREMTPADSAWMRIHDEPLGAGRVLLDSLLVGGTSNLLTPLWSLQWEVIFSLLLPVYLWVAVRFSRYWMLLGAGSLALSFTGVALHVDAFRFLPMFMLGALIAVKLPDLRNGSARISTQLWWAFLTGAIVLLTARWTLGEVPAGLMFLPAILGAIGIVVTAASWPDAARILERPAVLILGRISFSLYLIHEPVVLAVAQLLPHEMLAWTPVLAVPVSVAVAHLFFRLIEAPSHKLSQMVRNRLRQQRRNSQLAL
ncbi:acyltransferase family protein [Arthrobacter sp. H14-L1]|uniref:acyltransferase family protein n=1 Tax=Arthrobacter sp. H14-L1 TaxID=2996697 RepID=UPI00226F4BCA|nr:acyltransferase [Arthrobacter sp. H14-L1]MCY0905469.1 acyltransferase [Arthrobacter sp. H14-L1]